MRKYIIENETLMKEWDWELNNKDEIFPDKVSYGANKKPLPHWICQKCGHKWQDSAGHRTNGRGCPVCGHKKAGKTQILTTIARHGSFASLHPDLLVYWSDKNIDKPNEITEYCNKKQIWKCKDCGYEWQATTGSMIRGRRCPRCALERKKITRHNTEMAKNGSFADNCPELLKEWDYETNSLAGINPNEIPVSYQKPVAWICSKCGKKFKSYTYTRKNGADCPYCLQRKNFSLPEKLIYFYVKQTYPDTIPNYKPDFLKPREIDIFVPSLNVGIEYDGRIYHKKTERDIRKIKQCAEHGIKLYRIREERSERIDMDNVFQMEKRDDYLGMLKYLKRELNLNIDPDKVDIQSDLIKIHADINKYIMQNSLGKLFPDLTNELDNDLNLGLNPFMISANSELKVFWKCSKGHSYSTRICERTQRKRGCPYCAGRIAIKGENDLKTLRPDVAKYWDYTKNEKMPEDYKAKSSINVYWECPTCHAKWNCKISTMTKRKNLCLECFKKENQ